MRLLFLWLLIVFLGGCKTIKTIELSEKNSPLFPLNGSRFRLSSTPFYPVLYWDYIYKSSTFLRADPLRYYNREDSTRMMELRVLEADTRHPWKEGDTIQLLYPQNGLEHLNKPPYYVVNIEDGWFSVYPTQLYAKEEVLYALNEPLCFDALSPKIRQGEASWIFNFSETENFDEPDDRCYLSFLWCTAFYNEYFDALALFQKDFYTWINHHQQQQTTGVDTLFWGIPTAAERFVWAASFKKGLLDGVLRMGTWEASGEYAFGIMEAHFKQGIPFPYWRCWLPYESSEGTEWPMMQVRLSRQGTLLQDNFYWPHQKGYIAPDTIAWQWRGE